MGQNQNKKLLNREETMKWNEKTAYWNEMKQKTAYWMWEGICKWYI